MRSDSSDVVERTTLTTLKSTVARSDLPYIGAVTSRLVCPSDRIVLQWFTSAIGSSANGHVCPMMRAWTRRLSVLQSGHFRGFATTSAAMARTYAVRILEWLRRRPQIDIVFQDAVAALNTLQSNFAIVDAIRKSGRKMNEQAIPEMQEWCRKIGYEVCEPGRCICQRSPSRLVKTNWECNSHRT